MNQRMSQKMQWMAASLAVILWTATAAAAQVQEFVVPLSQPGQPVILEARLAQGGLTVEGFDGDQVVIESRSTDEDGAIEKVDGMFRIPNNSVGLVIEEDDNVVSLSTDWSGGEVLLHVQVPRQTSLRVQIMNGEDLVVSGVAGEHELKNVNGSIEARDMQGSVVATASNGDVLVEMVDLTDGAPMSFVSWNGDIDVTFPADLKATLKMQAGQGDILTDYEVALERTPAARSESKSGKGYRVEFNREITGTVGGGGAEIRLKTFNGDVIVRRQGG